MPNWKVHLEIAKRINQKQNYTGKELLFHKNNVKF